VTANIKHGRQYSYTAGGLDSQQVARQMIQKKREKTLLRRMIDREKQRKEKKEKKKKNLKKTSTLNRGQEPSSLTDGTVARTRAATGG
jgi:hypothetical protein